MPYSQDELREISDKMEPGDDPTLAKADKVPGAAEMKEGSEEILTRYTPVTVPTTENLIRRPESTLDWKNYAFEMVMPDGTRHDFVFTAKDDGDAQRKVNERIAATQHNQGTFKLSRLEAPKELQVGAFGGGDKKETVKETSEGDKKASAEKRQDAAKAQDADAQKAQQAKAADKAAKAPAKK